MRSEMLVGFMLGLTCLGGCTKDDPEAGEDGSTADGGAEDAGGGDGDGPATVLFRYTILGPPAGGFEFCNTDAEELGCATSDDAGVVTLEVPANADVALTVDRDGFVPTLYHRRTGGEDIELVQQARFTTDEQRASQEEALGIELDEDKGVLVAYAAGGLGGVGSASPGDPMPRYWVGGMVDPARTTIGGGAFVFYNVEPGEYEVTAEVPDKTCTASPISWPGDDAGSVRVRVVAGRWSYSNYLNCEGEPEFTGTFDPYEDAAACVGAESHVDAACWACSCERCLDTINQCGTEPGCIDIVQCAQRTGCRGDDCYRPDTCQAEIQNSPGDFEGAASGAAEDWDACVVAECRSACD